MFELMLGVDDEFRASDITPFDFCSDWSDSLSRSSTTNSWYFLQDLSNCDRSVNCHDGMTCQSNRS